jgi:hypothetical protein
MGKRMPFDVRYRGNARICVQFERSDGLPVRRDVSAARQYSTLVFVKVQNCPDPTSALRMAPAADSEELANCSAIFKVLEFALEKDKTYLIQFSSSAAREIEAVVRSATNKL